MLSYIRRLISSWFGQSPALEGEIIDSEEEMLWQQLVANGGCVDCTAKPKLLCEGPAGGMCVNVFCGHCGQGYNLTPVAHFAQRIHKDLRYLKENRDGR